MTDIEVINEIETLIGIELQHRPYLTNEPCYCLNKKKQVAEISLRKVEQKKVVSLSLLLQKLKGLTTIELISTNIFDYAFLNDLESLQSLRLWDNQFIEHSSLKDLTLLQSLNLRGNAISDSSFLKGMKQLQYLDLGGNNISDCSFLKEMKQLQSLDLGGNKISDFSFFKGLKQLQYLDLSVNEISDCSFIKDLGQLQSLELRENKISDCSYIKELKQLQSLDLSDNEISDCSFLKDLKQLQFLDLGKNKISDIVPLKDLCNLNRASFYDNQISELPEWITSFGAEIGYGQGGFDRLDFFANPLTHPPKEIVEQGNEAIRNYFNSIASVEGQTVRLKEVKLILIGDGMAGKTSLLKRLQGMEFDKDESQTHGINVVTLDSRGMPELDDLDDLAGLRIHCWDFGGQEIMHASHRFFLSERSVYILVLDSRTDNNKYHWLKHIEKYGGRSPLIVVMNKIDENPAYNIEQNQINKTFPWIKNRFHRISCKSGEGTTELVHRIGEAILESSLFGTELSPDWIEIKQQLEAETRTQRYISHARWQTICEMHNVSDSSSQQTLLRYLHDLGVVVYYEKLQLANLYVLDPHWVTVGVYKIINSQKTCNGYLQEKDLEQILNEEVVNGNEYDPARNNTFSYSREEQSYLLGIMKQFELCYEFDSEAGSYIIPDLLPKELENEPSFEAKRSVCLVFEYDYLPSSIITRLMLRFRNEIVSEQQWRYGMLLDNPEFACQAIIKMRNENKTITITVLGESALKRDYLSVIRHSLHDINKAFENLQVEQLIPLPGYDGYFVTYDELLGHERAGKKEYFRGELNENFSVAELLDAVISLEERSEESMKEKGNINITFSNIGNPQTQVNTEQHASQTSLQQQTNIVQEINKAQGLFKNLSQDILDEATIDEHEPKEIKRLVKDLENTGEALSELEKAANENKQEVAHSVKDRLEAFSEALFDKGSRFSQFLENISGGVKKAQKLAHAYNKLASYYGFQVIPEVFLGKEGT